MVSLILIKKKITNNRSNFTRGELVDLNNGVGPILLDLRRIDFTSCFGLGSFIRVLRLLSRIENLIYFLFYDC